MAFGEAATKNKLQGNRMLKNPVVPLIFLIAAFSPTTASAVAKVKEIRGLCSSNADSDKVVCKAYVAGVLEGSLVGQGVKLDIGPFCYDTTVDRSRLITTVIAMMDKDVKNFPQDDELAAAGFLAAAAMMAFPCKQTK